MTEAYSLERARQFWDRYFCDPVYGKTSEVLALNRSVEQLRKANRTYLPFPFRYIKECITWSGKQVLEFGCGQGNAAQWMAEQGAIVTACDIVASNVELTRRTLQGYPNRCVMLGTYQELDALGKFDIIFSYGCLHHIPSPFIEDAMRHLKKCLHSDGVFLALLYSTSYMPVESYNIEGPYTRGYSPLEVAMLFGEDMAIIDIEHVNVGSYMWVAGVRRKP